MPSEAGIKKRRATQACDYCHRRSIKCRVDEDDDQQRCTNCIQFGQACTRDRALKRRGVKAAITPTQNAQGPSQAFISTDSRYSSSSSLPIVRGTSSSSQSAALSPWKAPHIASQALIVDLVEAYFEIVYPIFPLFHRPSFMRRISRGEYATDQALFALTMAVCALCSARVSDNALAEPSQTAQDLTGVPSKRFYQSSVDALPKTDTPDQNLNIMRAYALLALTAIQYGNSRDMQGYLGKYHAMVAMDGLHDETNWPSDIGFIELEERRRLFWSMYTLDIFSTVVYKSVIRCREQQSNVKYTTELDDVYFDNSAYRVDPQSPVGTSPASNAAPNSWLHGWNITTDLWRLLEHVVIKLHSHSRRKRSFLEVVNAFETSLSAEGLQREVDSIYFTLPSHFRNISDMTGDATRDRYGYQAANITATVQLLRMVLLASEDNTIEERCQVVSEVVDAFMRIPIAYLRAISSPLLHHLGSIGSVLGGVLEEPLSEYQYQQVRTVLLSLAQLLENLDIGMHSLEAARKLRDLVVQINSYMARIQDSDEASPSWSFPDSHAHSLQVPQTLLTEWPFKMGSSYLA